jgi:hypothetical protein
VTCAFNIFEERSNVVIGEPGGRTTHCSRLDPEGLSLLYPCALGQGYSKSFVHHRFEWTPSPPRFSLEAGSNVIIQGERGSHTS